MQFPEIKHLSPLTLYGKVNKVSGYIIEATGLKAKVGTLCQIESSPTPVLAEVVGFKSDVTYLMSADELRGILPGSDVTQLDTFAKVPIGQGLLGRVIDSSGSPLDTLGPLKGVDYAPLHFEPINPLGRAQIRHPMDVGIKAINGLLTLGIGQRMGLFAGTGVGKSILLGMITKYCQADVVVISLVGERGREVKEFIEDNVGPQGLHKAVIVAAPADSSPLARVKAAETATFIAEYFKNKRKRVLLLMDSLTRYGQALRELGLALGEPPTNKGYPPSVFARIPKLVERAGNGATEDTSITGIYTVLAEGDDIQDPIVDCARGILDGHIVLARHLADSAHYPAIDIEQSISRVMDKVVSPEQLTLARSFKRSYSKYQQNRDFITIGAYQKGNDPELDQVLEKKPKLFAFLQQDKNVHVNMQQTAELLKEFANLSLLPVVK
ncbi:MAG: FliI/YscN family ATPase [Candidatus Berkiella sp.]